MRIHSLVSNDCNCARDANKECTANILFTAGGKLAIAHCFYWFAVDWVTTTITTNTTTTTGSSSTVQQHCITPHVHLYTSGCIFCTTVSRFIMQAAACKLMHDDKKPKQSCSLSKKTDSTMINLSRKMHVLIDESATYIYCCTVLCLDSCF